jgi:hypothetical protein
MAVPVFAQPPTAPPLVKVLQSQVSGERVSHGQISIKDGINQRIKKSSSGIADINIYPGGVLNKELLKLYAQKLALTEPIQSVVIDDDFVEMNVYGQGRLFRVIPIKLLHEVVVMIDGASIDVTVENKTSWSWLAQHAPAETVARDIRTHVKQSKFISVSQLKAYIIEGIVKSVTK